ncbi:FAD-dependent oxidoreductase, partial [bacterium]|nr:FAD-dependent oxidoreductase [bacterium]
MTERTCDLVVIGAGPGGYVAAARGARYGLDTVLVEKDDRLGGTCGLRGCIPTKALIQSARTWELCRKGARTFGVTVGEAAFAWDKVLKRKDLVVRKVSLGVAALVERSGVEVVRGHGRLDGPGRVVVAREGEDPLTITAAKVILATGSTTSRIPGIEPDGARVLTSDHLLSISAVPDSLIILGAGAVGVEFADVMNAFGCRVTLVEMLERIIPLEDADCSAELAHALGRKGVKIHAGHRASDVSVGADGVSARLTDVASGEEVTVTAEKLLVAAGRRPVTDDLGLDTVDAVVDRRGFVQVDGLMETAVPGLFAI